MRLRDRRPGFHPRDYEIDCPRCGGRVVYHFSNIHPAPESDGWACHIACKCLDRDCGRVEHYEPAISDEERSYLESVWGGRSFRAWEDEEVIEEVCGGEAAEAKRRLAKLGYL